MIGTSQGGPNKDRSPQARKMASEGPAGGNADMAEVESDENLEVSHELVDGDIVIAAITSCTNTSNPSVLVAAGLVARKAHELGLTRKQIGRASCRERVCQYV